MVRHQLVVGCWLTAAACSSSSQPGMDGYVQLGPDTHADFRSHVLSFFFSTACGSHDVLVYVHQFYLYFSPILFIFNSLFVLRSRVLFHSRVTEASPVTMGLDMRASWRTTMKTCQGQGADARAVLVRWDWGLCCVATCQPKMHPPPPSPQPERTSTGRASARCARHERIHIHNQ